MKKHKNALNNYKENWQQWFDRDNEKYDIQAFRDWFVTSVFTLVLSVVFILFAIFIFLSVTDDSQIVGVEKLQKESFDITTLERVVNTYDKKAQRHEQLKTELLQTFDPAGP